jgi:competence protein ComEC
MVAGFLWLCLWTTRIRLLGLVPVAIGAVAAWDSPTPDLLVTGDGRHLVVLGSDGTPLLLRDRAGDYIRQLMAEASGFAGDPEGLGEDPYSFCTRDSCVAAIRKGRGEWRILATRSANRIDWPRITDACGEADIAVSDRRLPRACVPRWLKLDRSGLARTGGVAVYLDDYPRVETVAERTGAHPWAQPMGQVSLHTASSLPDGSMKWNRRPPGKLKIGLAIVPPALLTESNAPSRSSTRMTGRGVESESDGSP